MSYSIAKDFRFFSLLRFALPTMIMMVFMSLYTIVDGIFISRLVGTDALSATNIVYPVLNLVIAIGVMLATGGSAIIAKKMGGGKDAGSAGRLLFPDRYRNHPRIPCDVSRKHIYNSARTTARRNRSDPGSLHRIFKRIPFFGACLYLTTALSGIFCHCRKTDHRTDPHDQRRRCQYDP